MTRPRLPHAVAAIALAGAILVAYAGSLETGLVYDNAFIIRRAPRVHAATWANVVEIFTSDYWWPFNVHGVYRPLATLSYLVNWAVLGNGAQPAGYHWVNLALHWGNALLVYALGVSALGISAGSAFLIALLFATHPVATEAVTNIIGRADELAAIAVLAGLLSYVRAVRATTPHARRGWLAATATATFLGLLAKESAVVLVGAIVLYDYVFALPLPERAGLRRRAAELLRIARSRWLVLAIPLAAIWLIRWRVFRDHPPWTIGIELNPLAGTDFWTARWTALEALARAVSIFVWPATLCPDYSQNEIPIIAGPLGWRDPRPLAALLGAAIAIALVAILRRRDRAASFFLGFFLVALLPTSNLLFVSTTLLAERLLYLPLVGFAGCVVLAIEWLAARGALLVGRSRPPSPRVARAIASLTVALIACAYAARTTRRNLDWRDDVTLWSAAVDSCPGSYRSHELLGAALFNPLDSSDRAAGEIDRAIALQERSLAIVEASAPAGAAAPPTIFERLGFLYFRKAQLEDKTAASPALAAETSAMWGAKAADAFERAVAGFAAEREARRRTWGTRADASPDLAGPLLFDTFGVALLRAGRPDRAVDVFVQARARAPWDAGVHEHLATAYQRSGRSAEALSSLLEAVAVAPERADLKSAVIAVDGQLRPGQCGFVLEGERLSFSGDCPEAHRAACAAYTRLRDALDAAPIGAGPNAAPDRREALTTRIRGVVEGLRCADLAPP